MLKFVIALILFIVVIVFASQNMESVDVSFVFGEQVKLPLFFLILSSFFFGVVISVFIDTVVHIKQKRVRDKG